MTSPTDRHRDVTSPRHYVTSSVYAVSSPQPTFSHHPITVGSHCDVIVAADDVIDGSSRTPLVSAAGEATPLVRTEINAFFSPDVRAARESCGSGGISKSGGVAGSPRFVFEVAGAAPDAARRTSIETGGRSPGGTNFVVKSADGMRVTHLRRASALDDVIAPSPSPSYAVTSRQLAGGISPSVVSNNVESDVFGISSRAIPTDVRHAVSPGVTHRELATRVLRVESATGADQFPSRIRISSAGMTSPPGGVEKQVSVVVHSVDSATNSGENSSEHDDASKSNVKSEINLNAETSCLNSVVVSSRIHPASTANVLFVGGVESDAQSHAEQIRGAAKMSSDPEIQAEFLSGERRTEISNIVTSSEIADLQSSSCQDKMAADLKDGGHDVESSIKSMQKSAVPVFDRKLKSTSVGEGGGATLSCHVTGCPEPIVKWEKDGKAIGVDSKNIEVGL